MSVTTSQPSSTPNVNNCAVANAQLAHEDLNPLPFPEQISTANFQWGEHDGSHLEPIIESAYAEAIHWRRNIFMIPSGKVGKEYVKEQARLFNAYSDGMPLERIAL